MGYSKGPGQCEAASKIAHMKMIESPVIQGLVQSLIMDTAPTPPTGALPTISFNLAGATRIREVVTVDGGLQTVPNPVRRDKAMSFVNTGVSFLKFEHLRMIEEDPFFDPRELGGMLRRCMTSPAVFPLRGVRMANRSMKDTLRETINACFFASQTGLYEVLEFLLFEDWIPVGQRVPGREMYCLGTGCEARVPLPDPNAAHRQRFNCPTCGHEHYLSDYLGVLSGDAADELPSEGVAHQMMAIIETLSLFKLPMRLFKEGQKRGGGTVALREHLKRFLFIKDGSLMLRASGYRLVDGVRRFLAWLHEQKIAYHLVGVEKSGRMADFLADIPAATPKPGDVFIPSKRFLMEEINGVVFDTDKADARDRVSWGTRMGARLSPEHVIALQVPAIGVEDSGGPMEPKPADFPHLEETLRALAKLTSARFENALTPLVVVNDQVSLSQGSSSLLEEYVTRLLKGENP